METKGDIINSYGSLLCRQLSAWEQQNSMCVAHTKEHKRCLQRRLQLWDIVTFATSKSCFANRIQVCLDFLVWNIRCKAVYLNKKHLNNVYYLSMTLAIYGSCISMLCSSSSTLIFITSNNPLAKSSSFTRRQNVWLMPNC